jgi:D-proline reductase (dithiol) PrdB
VGLLARIVEEVGISTVYVGSARDMMAQVKPPRPVFVNFPLGHQCGRPFDRELQMSVIKDALSTLTTLQEPGQITDLPYEWGVEFTYAPGGGELPPDQQPPAR